MSENFVPNQAGNNTILSNVASDVSKRNQQLILPSPKLSSPWTTSSRGRNLSHSSIDSPHLNCTYIRSSWRMQSLSSKIRLIGRNDRMVLAQRYLCRQPVLISKTRDTRAKLLLVRQFSKKASAPSGSSPGNHRSYGSSFYSFFGWYSKKLDTHPISTKCVSAALVSSVGSVLAQVISHRQDEQEHANDKNKKGRQEPFEIDYEKVSRFVFLNIVYVAPVLHHWYEFVNRALPGRSFYRVLQRTFCDEFLFSPVYIPVLLGMLWKLEGKTNDNIFKMIKNELPFIIVTEWVSNVNAIFEQIVSILRLLSSALTFPTVD